MPQPYGQPNSGSYQIDYQTLCSSLALVSVENMDTLEIDTRRLERTPPPQVFSPGHDAWHNQATSQQQYHVTLSEQVAYPWRGGFYSNDHRDGNVGFCSPSIYGSGPTQDTPPDDSSSPRSLGRSSHSGTVGSYGTLESYGSSNTSYSQPAGTGSGSTDPIFMESVSPLEISLTGIPLVASPEELAAAASSPTLFHHHQSGSAAQVAVYTTHPTNGYFDYSPNHSQYLVRQEQRLASGPQDQGPYPDLNAGSLGFSPPPPPPPPPHQPTYPGDEGGAIADHPNSNPHECCGVAFGRRTDMERHQRTSKKHNKGGHGPTCPVRGCKCYTLNFTRPDNFRVHCRKLHGMSTDKINTYLREREYRKMP